MPYDFFEIAVASRAVDRAHEFVGEIVEPAVVDADADRMNAQLPDEFVVFINGAGDDEHALVRHVLFVFHDGGVDAVGAFPDDIAMGELGAIVNLVRIFEKDDTLSFVDDFGFHVLREILSEFFVQSESPLIAVNGDEDLRVGQFNEQFEFALAAVPRAVEGEVGAIDEASALPIKPVDDGVDAAFIAGNLSSGVDERVGWAKLDFRVHALGDAEERRRFFALRSGDDEDEIIGIFVDIFFAENFEVLRNSNIT